MASLVDSHVHVGSFGNGRYFDPIETGRFLVRRGISCCVASSTTAARECHSVATNELSDMMFVQGLTVWPLLWVTPRLISKHPDLRKPLQALPYRGLKIHPRANKWSDSSLLKVFALAGRKRLPILIHTDEDPDSNPARYESLISGHGAVKVVLAHGRPFDQTLQVMRRYPNVAVDTAFMPTSHIRRFFQEGMADRILFGSDMPIDRCFYTSSPAQRYDHRLKSVRRVAGKDCASLIMGQNCIRYFALEA